MIIVSRSYTGCVLVCLYRLLRFSEVFIFFSTVFSHHVLLNNNSCRNYRQQCRLNITKNMGMQCCLKPHSFGSCSDSSGLCYLCKMMAGRLEQLRPPFLYLPINHQCACIKDFYHCNTWLTCKCQGFSVSLSLLERTTSIFSQM